MADESQDSFSDTSMLSEEERAIVERMRRDHARLHAQRGRRGQGLSPEKQDFPIGIKPDGTVNRVPDDGDESGYA